MIPVILQTQWFTIQSLHVFFILGLIAGAHYLLKKLKRRRMELLILVEHLSALSLMSLFVARLFAVIDDWKAYELRFDFDSIRRFLSIWDNGLSTDAAITSFTLGLLWLLYKNKLNIKAWLDALAPSILILIAVTEIGAFLSGYAYGIPSKLPWAIEYSVYHVQYTSSVHPTQIYTMLWIAFVFGLDYVLRKKTTFLEKEDGNQALFFFTSFMIGNTAIELLRGTNENSFFHLSSIDFVIYLTLSVLSIFYSYKQYKKQRKSATLG